jgi:TRAP-type C4-dicarboxylate transport system permease small subunit
MTSDVIGGKISGFMDRVEKIINLLCVIFLTCQVVSIIVMVFGRYLFSYVPRATEEFALFCMVWFSLLSISLSIRDDSHIKMEIMDALVARDKLKYFQYFAAILTLGFSIPMVVYGVKLVELTRRTSMSGFEISEGWLYLAIPVSGVCMALTGIVFFLEKIREYRRDN